MTQMEIGIFLGLEQSNPFRFSYFMYNTDFILVINMTISAEIIVYYLFLLHIAVLQSEYLLDMKVMKVVRRVLSPLGKKIYIFPKNIVILAKQHLLSERLHYELLSTEF